MRVETSVTFSHFLSDYVKHQPWAHLSGKRTQLWNAGQKYFCPEPITQENHSNPQYFLF